MKYRISKSFGFCAMTFANFAITRIDDDGTGRDFAWFAKLKDARHYLKLINSVDTGGKIAPRKIPT